MEMSHYLLIGVLIAGLLFYRQSAVLVFATCAYWLTVTLSVAGTLQIFSFHSIRWLDFLHIDISFLDDGLSRLFTLLIAAMGVLVFLYAWFYTRETPQHRKKLFSLLQLFAVAMLGIVLSDDLIFLFLCWELTSITSYLLIQFDVTDSTANQAAFNSLFVSVAGGLVMLVGFILLHHVSGSWSISKAISQSTITDSAQLMPIFYLIVCGVITKSAQFPFYFWLTGAMKAPTPVSAYLHSATMVNAGIYLLARFHPLLAPLSVWYPTLSIFGLITILLSGFLSIFQNDLKSILAYTTIFALGVMVYLLGGNTQLPIEAFAVFLLFHGIYKAAAFMLVGMIDQEYKTRQLDRLCGIARHRIFLGLIVTVVFGAMAGIPPFFGFTAKQMIYEAKLASSSISYFLILSSMVGSMLIAAASFRCIWAFFGPGNSLTGTADRKNHYPYLLLLATLLAGCILLFSVFDHLVSIFIEPAVQSIILNQSTAYITPNTRASFILSMVTAIGGLILFIFSLFSQRISWQWLSWLELRRVFESTFNGLLAVGKYMTTMTQDQPFCIQLRIFFVAISCIVLFIGIENPIVWSKNWLQITTYPDFFVCCLLLLSSISLLVSVRFLYNLISLSLFGFAVSFFFLINGAVDVAITQLLVEVLTIIMLLLALRPIELTTPIKDHQFSRLINAMIAMLFGLTVTYMLFTLKTTVFNDQLQSFYANNSLLNAHGRNIVNVILVDFRSLDTFGEAMVIVAAAVGASWLLKKHVTMQRE